MKLAELQKYIGKKRIILLIGFLAMTAAAWYSWRTGLVTPEMLFKYIDANPVLAPVVLVLCYALCVLFIIPTLPLNLGLGFFFGPFYGSILALLGSGGGSIIAFLFSRTVLGRPLARRFDNKILDWLNTSLAERGWKVVAFIRLNPVLPTGPLNFLFGLTSIPARTYIWATLVFLYPPSLAFAWLGDVAQGLVLDGWQATVFKGALAVSAAITLLYGGRVLGRILFGKKDDSQ